MQDRYTGDIGDFGKLGLLRQLSTRSSIGVNWYLVPDERHNRDGRHIEYLTKNSFQICDPLLFDALARIVGSARRQVMALEDPAILSAVYYSEALNFCRSTKAERQAVRSAWHQNALAKLNGCELVFVDPDNGLIVPSAEGRPKSNKYVLPSELADYYGQGSSVVYYQHKAQSPDEFYVRQHRQLMGSGAFPGAGGAGLKFVSTSQRFYFFLLQPKHIALAAACIGRMLASPWSRYFQLLEGSDLQCPRSGYEKAPGKHVAL